MRASLSYCGLKRLPTTSLRYANILFLLSTSRSDCQHRACARCRCPTYKDFLQSLPRSRQPANTAPDRAYGGNQAARHPQKQNNDEDPVSHLPQLAEIDQDLVDDREGDRPDDRAEQSADPAKGQHHQHNNVDLAEPKGGWADPSFGEGVGGASQTEHRRPDQRPVYPVTG